MELTQLPTNANELQHLVLRENQILLLEPTARPEVEADLEVDLEVDPTEDRPPPRSPGRRRRKRRTGGHRVLPAHLERVEITSAEMEPKFALAKPLCRDSSRANVLTDKFVDHLPLNRQSKRFKREAGVDIAVSTMCGRVRSSAELLGRVVDVMADELRSGAFIQSDATDLPILDGAKTRPRRGHLWSDTHGTQVVTKASLDGRYKHPAEFLAGFKGMQLNQRSIDR